MPSCTPTSLIKTINPKAESKSAKNLTMAQIGQLSTGTICSAGVLVIGEKYDTASSRFGLACMQVYRCGLITLLANLKLSIPSGVRLLNGLTQELEIENN
jgi:hypothetical protein